MFMGLEKNQLPEELKSSPEMKLHPISLSFSGDWKHLEKEFLYSYNSKSVKYIRLAFLFGIFFYSIFGFLDAVMAPDKKHLLWFIRYALICPGLFVCILLSFLSDFQKFSQLVIVSAIIIAGSGISVMMALVSSPASSSYYAGIILVLMFGYGFIRARFIWASLGGWVNVIIYEIVAIWIVQTPVYVLINNNFFFISANIIGMVTCYSFEFSARKEFFTARMLAEEREKVMTLNRSLEKKVSQRTLELQSAYEKLQKETEDRELFQAKLIQAQRMESVGRLAGGVAHDFNNILSVIIGSSEMVLLETDKDDPRYEDLTIILDAALKSTEITKQLLAFARQQTAAPKVLDINSTIENMLKMLVRLIDEGVELIWLPGENVWPVKIDPSQMDQIITNLCVNGKDAIEDTGCITLETANIRLDERYCQQHLGAVPGDYVLLTVSDSGYGMDEETMRKIFEPFFTTKGLHKGTGLGLATVYGIIKQNDGYIYVDSELGGGTRFRVYLPRHTGDSLDSIEDKSLEPCIGNGETILLVEDDPSILEITAKVLGQLNYSVFPTGSPAKAIQLMEEKKGEIDLLITDVVMPEMNGRELSVELTKICGSLKTLFMSGYPADVIGHRGVLEDGVNFIEKPLSKNELSRKVKETLGQGNI